MFPGHDRTTVVAVMADPDEHCPDTWIERDSDTGYCEPGDECPKTTHAEADSNS